MKLPLDNYMDLDIQTEEHTAAPAAKFLVNNIIGSFLMLCFVILVVCLLLAPDLNRSIKSAAGQGFWPWLGVLLYSAMLFFMLAVPGACLYRSILNYRHARDLERFGLMTRGRILDRWVDDTQAVSLYKIRYVYLGKHVATQVVDEVTYRLIEHETSIFVLYLEHLPEISCLDLDE